MDSEHDASNESKDKVTRDSPVEKYSNAVNSCTTDSVCDMGIEIDMGMK